MANLKTKSSTDLYEGFTENAVGCHTIQHYTIKEIVIKKDVIMIRINCLFILIDK